jgi:hypothetical protein
MKQKIKKIFENAVWWSGVIMVGFVLGLTIQFVKAWTEPTAAPLAGNVDAPINTGIGQQWKGLGGIGSMGLTGVLEALDLKVDSKLDTAGNILPDVTGKFLAAKDASGQVAWATGGGGNYALSCSTWNYSSTQSPSTVCCRMDNLSGQTECKINYDWAQGGWITFRNKPW